MSNKNKKTEDEQAKKGYTGNGQENGGKSDESKQYSDVNEQEENQQQEQTAQEESSGEEEATEQEQGEASEKGQEETSEKEQEQQATQTEEDWQKKYQELNDKYLRLFSEFDNFRKRTQREKSELIHSASEDLIKEMLSLVDDMERALQNIGDDQKEAGEGMELIYNKFLKILKQNGLKEMKSKGEPFNTDYHEAISQMQAPEKNMKGKVIEEVEKGYFLNDKVIRFAKVVVGN